MPHPLRPLAFVLAASNHGTMIVNRNDYQMTSPDAGYGVGFQILNQSSFDPAEVCLVLDLLDSRRRHFGDRVVAIDGGANIGVHTIEWARHMYGWGQVRSFEAQELVFYALAGNIALNNCFNTYARNAALGQTCGELSIPQANPYIPASYGSLEMKKRADTEFIGQEISYAAEDCAMVPMVSIDSLNLPRLDLVKLDVEGMELEVIRGALDTLKRHLPVMLVEIMKSDRAAIETLLLGLGYKVFPQGINILAIHKTDPTLGSIKVPGTGTP